jgi:hypothetical protein
MKELNLKIDGYEINVPVFQRDGKNWVALKPICEALGVAWKRQQTKFGEESTIPHMVAVGLAEDGKQREMICIDVDYIGEWIFGINPNKVKPEVRERMVVFRRKLQAVLYAAVTGHIDTNMVHTLVEEMKQLKEVIRQQQQLIDYLIQESSLNRRYVDQRLSSVGGKLLSSMAHKKRKAPVVG